MNVASKKAWSIGVVLAVVGGAFLAASPAAHGQGKGGGKGGGGGPKSCSPQDLLENAIPITITYVNYFDSASPSPTSPRGIYGDTFPDVTTAYGEKAEAKLDCSGEITMANVVDFEDTGRQLTFDFTADAQAPTEPGTLCGTEDNDPCKATFTDPGERLTTPFGWFNVRAVDDNGKYKGGAICMAPGDTTDAKLLVRFPDPEAKVNLSVQFNPFQDTPGYAFTNVFSVTRCAAGTAVSGCEDENAQTIYDDNTWVVDAPEVGDPPDPTTPLAEVGNVGNLRAAAEKRFGPTNEGNYRLPFRAIVRCSDPTQCSVPANCP